jgi:hypothetical protein
MKYRGTATPAARNAAIPQAVAWWLPCLLAWANTPVAIAAASATVMRNVSGLGEVTAEHDTGAEPDR